MFRCVNLESSYSSPLDKSSALATLELLSTVTKQNIPRRVQTLHLPRFDYYDNETALVLRQACLNALRQTKSLRRLVFAGVPYDGEAEEKQLIEALRTLDSPLKELEVGKWEEWVDIPHDQDGGLSRSLEVLRCTIWRSLQQCESALFQPSPQADCLDLSWFW